MIHLYRLLLLTAIGLGSLAASTQYIRGIIVEIIKVDGAFVTFVVAQDFNSRTSFGQADQVTIRTKEESLVTLEGKMATAADAIKKGRTAFISIGRRQVRRVDVLQLARQEILPKPAKVDSGNGAVEFTIPAGSGKKATKIHLSVAVRGGAVHSGQVKHADKLVRADVSALKAEAGRLVGTVTVDLPYRSRSWMPSDKKRGPNPVSMTIDAVLASSDPVTVHVDCMGTASKALTQVAFRACRKTPADGRVVFRSSQPRSCYYETSPLPVVR